MLSPSPLSLLCALLLCLPLAILFTITCPTAGGDGSTSRLNNHTPESPSPPPPPPPPIPKDDESLLRVAARVNSRPTSPRKLAFMFLTTTPLWLAPLWEVYFNGTNKSLYNIYVHADPSFEYDPPFTGVFFGRCILSKPSLRYSPTLISAARRLLAHALLHDSGNYMFAILSPSCVPIHSFDFTYKTLVRSKKSFIEILQNEPGTYDRWAARGQDAMLPVVRLEEFRIGSQFWVLTRRHARLVVDDEIIWDKFNQPCTRKLEYTCYPEENYFPTLLHMRDPIGCVPATLTHVDWSVSNDGHPREYTPFQVGPELISKLRSDRPRYGDDGSNGSDSSVRERRDRHHPFLFARKFSRESIDRLLWLANDVILKD
ncbi:hypothetical protein Dsin_016749 [Dipteronia sinensis]|uniref:Uncharacterized protein n=1 Tax=Dipteronia sinensis TaxID=43782 RepID=A0AAE0AEH8_9ROSI|nr:hypothetical protein Dsin_016749 [Dipteronia sinensis]